MSSAGEMVTMRAELSALRNELKGAFEKEVKEPTRWVVALVGLIATIMVISNFLAA